MKAERAAQAPAQPRQARRRPRRRRGGDESDGEEGAFRETAWFKRGEIEEEMAKARGRRRRERAQDRRHRAAPAVDESQVDADGAGPARLSLKTGRDRRRCRSIKAPVRRCRASGWTRTRCWPSSTRRGSSFLIAGAIVLAIVLGLVSTSPRGRRRRPRRRARQAGARRCGAAGDGVAFDPAFRRCRYAVLTRNLSRLRRRAAAPPITVAVRGAGSQARGQAGERQGSRSASRSSSRRSSRSRTRRRSSARRGAPIASCWRG